MENDLLTYLKNYKNQSLNELPFNEVDALIFASLSYPKFDEILGIVDTYSNEEILTLINDFNQTSLSDRKKLNIALLKEVCESKRFEGIKLFHYRKSMNKDISKQFQAVSFMMDDLIIVSFCGTDGTTTGWKEDLNMSYLELTPSEIEAMNYLKEINELYHEKSLILVGHSKGGRLVVSSAKYMQNKDKIKEIYTFDAPNYANDFYDEEYQKIESKIYSYVPEESIIGRLINEPRNPIIVKSKNSLIQQHDISSWCVIDNHLVEVESGYSKQSTKISKALNGTLERYDNKTKKEFSDIVFGFIDRLDIHEFKSKEENLILLKQSIKYVPKEWKNTPKEDRALLKTILFRMIKDYIFGN